MNNKKIFLFAFLSLFLVGCDSIGGVNLTDTRGNKYQFKDESVNCSIKSEIKPDIYCEGSAIKKNIAGSKFAYSFEEENCVEYKQRYAKSYWGKPQIPYAYYAETESTLLCQAAEQLGKITPLKTYKEYGKPN